ncbi:MAG: hypothetical protein V4850_23640 [Myxococcota bacterium]
MSPRVRKLALVLHVAASVGWLGGVAAFLALALVGLNGTDEQTVRAVYISMDLETRFVLVPLALASLGTGIIQSLGTPWGLVRHWWVVVKLLLTLVATGLLLLHTRPIAFMARAAQGSLAAGAHADVRLQLVVTSAAAIALLLVTTGLSVFKPPGVTRYGWRKQREERLAARA